MSIKRFIEWLLKSSYTSNENVKILFLYYDVPNTN